MINATSRIEGLLSLIYRLQTDSGTHKPLAAGSMPTDATDSLIGCLTQIVTVTHCDIMRVDKRRD